MTKKFLSIDYGEKFLGLATFHQGFDPFPLKYGRISNRGNTLIYKDLKHILEQEDVTDIICGVPYFTDGKESSNTRKIKDFLAKLKSFCGGNYRYHEQDETLTSHEAKDRMLNSAEYNFSIDLKQIDALSAQIILEDFIKKSASS